MPAPRQDGFGQVFRSSSQFRKGLVRDISADGTTCDMVDLNLGGTFDAMTMTPEGRVPQIGDVWMCAMDTGMWRPIAMLDPMSNYVNLDRSLDLMLELVRRGSIEWSPFDTSMPTAEMPHGGYIGERRLFDVIPSTRWIQLNGSTQRRHRYRALWDLVAPGIPGNGYGVGNGTTTFTMPNCWTPTPGTAVWCVAAE